MASPWQTIRAIRARVAAAPWDTSPSGLIIGSSAYISAGVENDAQLPGRLPFAFLNVGTQTGDLDDAGLVKQEFNLVLVTGVEGHDLGEFNLIGGPSGKTPRSAYSQGRGILEIENGVLAEVKTLTGADGCPILVEHISAAAPQWLRGRSVVWRQYVLSAWCTRADEYPAPRQLVATGGSGEIVLAWDLPPSRFDLDSVILRYASGATPPASATAGTGITLASSLATSVTLSGLGAGTYSVAAFAKYIDTNANDPKYSDQETGSYRASVSVS